MTFRVHCHEIERTVGASFSFFFKLLVCFFPSKLQLETFIRLTGFSFHIVRLCLPFLLYLFSVSSRYTFIRLRSFVVSLIRTLSHIAPPLQHFISYLSISQTFSHPFVAAFYFTLLPPRAFQFPPSFHSISSFVTLTFTWLLPSSSFPLLETHSRVGLPVYFLPGTALVFRFAPHGHRPFIAQKASCTRSAEIAHLYVYSYTYRYIYLFVA